MKHHVLMNTISPLASVLTELLIYLNMHRSVHFEGDCVKSELQTHVPRTPQHTVASVTCMYFLSLSFGQMEVPSTNDTPRDRRVP